MGPARDLIQAYCDVLEEKWYLSEQSGNDAGLAAAIDAYLALGAPAPEIVRGNDATPLIDAVQDEAIAEIDAFARTDPPVGEDVEHESLRANANAPEMAPSDR